MAKQVIGQVTIRVGDLLLKSKNGATLNPGGPQRTPVANDQRTIDYQEGEVLNSTVECVLVVDTDYNSDVINDLVNKQLTFTGDNGLVWSITGATVESPPTISNGEAPATFFGDPATQL